MARATFKKGAKLRRWEKNFDDPRRALKQIGALAVSESQLAFRDQKFDGEAWPPRSDVNVFGIIADFAQGRRSPPARRFQRRPALRDTGRLAASVSFRIVGSKVVEIGSNLSYAAKHQAGGETESETITKKVRRLLWLWLRNRGVELRRRLGWLLNRKFLDQRIKGEVPQRRFVGITRTLRRDAVRVVGVEIMEAR